MMNRTTRETDRFSTLTPNGDVVVVVEYTSITSYHSNAGSRSVPGVKSLVTEDGIAVNFKGPGTYELQDGTPLVRV
jgi:hypothetical protein